MKKNVLIFGGGGYNAIQIYFSLKNTLRYHPVLVSGNDNHSTFISNDAVIDLPYDSDPNFVDALNLCIEKTDAEYILPTHDTAALRLMENEEDIHAIIVCSPRKTAKICRYKSLTYQALEGLDFLPEIYHLKDNNIKFPVFAKDDMGQGGKYAELIHSPDEFCKLKKDISYILCEYLPGEEITVDCFTDRYGRLRFAQPRIRERVLNGISARASLFPLTEEIRHIVTEIGKRIAFRGYWYVQCKKDKKNRYKLLEISTRFAGTFSLSKNLDVNLPLLALQDFSECDVDIMPNQYDLVLDKTYIDRYRLNYFYERVYIDFDDTLVFDKTRYNTVGMQFLYQCFNQKKQLILITKHESDLHATAKDIHFNLELFDEIIEVPLDKMKYSYMNDEIPSIFIDNAFSERKAVKEHLKMPTFDIVNIECLIDWRE